MKSNPENPFEALEKIFHEPNRLAIMSAICAVDGGVTFTELKDTCRLTDGNLNRHLKVLEEAGAIKIEKAFVQLKPRTTIYMTKTGLQRFQEYLAALSGVLEHAQKAAGTEPKKTARLAFGKIVTA